MSPTIRATGKATSKAVSSEKSCKAAGTLDSPIWLKFPDAIQVLPAFPAHLGPWVLWPRVVRVHISGPGSWQRVVDADAARRHIKRITGQPILSHPHVPALHDCKNSVTYLLLTDQSLAAQGYRHWQPQSRWQNEANSPSNGICSVHQIGGRIASRMSSFLISLTKPVSHQQYKYKRTLLNVPGPLTGIPFGNSRSDFMFVVVCCRRADALFGFCASNTCLIWSRVAAPAWVCWLVDNARSPLLSLLASRRCSWAEVT